MESSALDSERSNAFAERMVGMLNEAALSLMASIGHRTGLYDMMAILPPSSSEQIAKAAHLNERYVREWLATQVIGHIVNYDAGSQTYHLPAEHAAFLTRKAEADNVALFCQYIALMGDVEDGIVNAFRHGGGVPYSEFPRFHQVMAEESAVTIVARLVDTILPAIPGLVERLDEGIDVLDVGCGSGRAINAMALAFPRSRFTGFDFSEEAVTNARNQAIAMGIRNSCFSVMDVAQMDERATCDLVTTFDAIHDQARPQEVLSAIARALRPHGTYLMQDIRGSSHLHNNLDHPTAPFLYTISTMHCMTVSLALGGDGLGTMWGEERAMDMLKTAGFNDVALVNFDHDANNTYYVSRL
jgi:2-polyprenyl-3-methyl-5-hydroxy-6-metoxy-1,4-benzoquinol methylase